MRIGSGYVDFAAVGGIAVAVCESGEASRELTRRHATNRGATWERAHAPACATVKSRSAGVGLAPVASAIAISVTREADRAAPPLGAHRAAVRGRGTSVPTHSAVAGIAVEVDAVFTTPEQPRRARRDRRGFCGHGPIGQSINLSSVEVRGINGYARAVVDGGVIRHIRVPLRGDVGCRVSTPFGIYGDVDPNAAVGSRSTVGETPWKVPGVGDQFSVCHCGDTLAQPRIASHFSRAGYPRAGPCEEHPKQAGLIARRTNERPLNHHRVDGGAPLVARATEHFDPHRSVVSIGAGGNWHPERQGHATRIEAELHGLTCEQWPPAVALSHCENHR